MSEKLRFDLAGAIETSLAVDGSDGTLAEREAAVRRLLAESIEIVCVDAKDYLQVVEKQAVGRFLSDEAATNVPRLREVLRALGKRTVDDRNNAIETAHAELYASLMEAVHLVGRAYEEGGGSATAQWERFRTLLASAVTPVKAALDDGRRAATKDLRENLPQRIEQLCVDAELNAHK
jgi:hypothetical protein